LAGNMLGGWGFRFVQIKGLFWGPIRGKIRGGGIINLQKSSSHEPRTGRNTLIFSMEHPWGKEIQGCSNKVPRVMYDPIPLNLYIVIYREML